MCVQVCSCLLARPPTNAAHTDQTSNQAGHSAACPVSHHALFCTTFLQEAGRLTSLAKSGLTSLPRSRVSPCANGALRSMSSVLTTSNYPPHALRESRIAFTSPSASVQLNVRTPAPTLNLPSWKDSLVNTKTPHRSQAASFQNPRARMGRVRHVHRASALLPAQGRADCLS
jgi:hypothetical protein